MEESGQVYRERWRGVCRCNGILATNLHSCLAVVSIAALGARVFTKSVFIVAHATREKC